MDLKKGLILWIAQGFGAGRIPVAPGTFGTAVGLLWFAVLVAGQSVWLFFGGIVGGFALSVWLCGAAEAILGETDPSSVVLDEITALPICFAPWTASHLLRQGKMPELEVFFSDRSWYITLTLFLLFRFFDVLKPWPIRQSQSLPGGWGVTVDDFLAAAAVAAMTLAFLI